MGRRERMSEREREREAGRDGEMEELRDIKHEIIFDVLIPLRPNPCRQVGRLAGR